MKCFGDFVRKIRIRNSITLREFCRKAKLDPSNWSKIERGLIRPPKSKLALLNIADSLNIKVRTDEYKTLQVLAAVEFIPFEILPKENILDILPVFLSTVKGDKLNESDLKKIIDILLNG